jgi:chaperonin GroES
VAPGQELPPVQPTRPVLGYERTAMKVRPLHDRVIIERIEDTEQRIGAIIIPDSAKEKPQQGKILAAGKGRHEKDGKVTPLDVKAGDTILFGKYAGQEIKIDGHEYLIMREEEVLGVIETKQHGIPGRS